MEQMIQEKIAAFRLPAYDDIPNVGLFLEQVTKYISDYLQPLSSFSVTGSMISNYVKKGLVDKPVRKQYSREQIAVLLYIVIAKTVLSLEHIQMTLQLQQHSYSVQRAYEYFRLELENVLAYVFGLKAELDTVGVDSSPEKSILRNTIIAVAHKVYLDQCLTTAKKNASDETPNQPVDDSLIS